MNIAAAATTEVAKNSDAPTGRPTLDSAPTTAVSRAVGTHSATSPTKSPPAACDAAFRRVVQPDRNSSHRPASSSPRRSRVAISSPQTAPRIMRNIRALYAV
jgi:hypothetical protein